MRCPVWPLGSNYRPINADGTLTNVATQLYLIGPKAGLAWLVYNLTFSYSAPLITAMNVAPFYQFNNSERERLPINRITLGSNVSTDAQVFPIIGGMSARNTNSEQLVPQQRTFYLPYPNELIIGLTSVPSSAAGQAFQIRALVLEVGLDVDVSLFM